MSTEPAKIAVLRIPASAWLAIALALALAMASHDSLWIDELQTTQIAHIEGLPNALNAIAQSRYSEAQMPGYMLYAWLWEKFSGGSEWQLRLSNLPWLAIAVWSMYRIATTLGVKLLLPVLLVQPFLWTYLDEFRPYCMQMAGGALLLWAAVQFSWSQGRGAAWAVNLIVAGLILCSASMLCAVTVLLAYSYIASTLWRRKLPIERPAVVALAIGNAVLLALGAYYAWTLTRGVGGAKLWSVGLANVGVVFYEFLGFSGLGPARDAIRDAAREGSGALVQLFTPQLAGLAALAACYAMLIAVQASRPLKGSGARFGSAGVIAAYLLLGSIAALLTLAAAVHWPFWGRHLAPVFASWCLLLALLAERAWGVRAGRAIVAALLAALAASSLMMRIAPAHRHDDYRGAGQELARALDRGQRVWWAARGLGDSKLYSGSFRHPAAASHLTQFMSPTAEEVAGAPTPDIIIISKRDIYDAHEAIGAYIEDHGFEFMRQLKAFQVWRAAVAPAAAEN